MQMLRKEGALWAALFLDLVGFTVVLVDFQFKALSLGAQGWQIGAILSATFVVQVLVSPLWGRLSDTWGRKPVFLICTFFSALSMAVYALAPSLLFLLLGRLIAGLGGASTAIAQASIADQFSGDERAAAIGRLTAAQNLGMVLGPVGGGLFAAAYGSTSAGLAAAGASLLGMGIAWAGAAMAKGKVEDDHRSFRFGQVVRDFPALRILFAAAAVSWFSIAMLEGTFGRLIKGTLNLGEREFGLLFGFESIVWVGVSALLLPWAVKAPSVHRLLAASCVVMGAGAAFFPIAPSFAWLFLGSLLFALGNGLASPLVSALCSRAVDESRQGEMFGLLQGARSIGFVAGPALGGALMDVQIGLPYYLAGGVCLAAAAMVAGWAPKTAGRLDPPQ